MINRCFDYRLVNKFWPKSESEYAVVSSKIIYLLEDNLGMWIFNKYKTGLQIHVNMGKDCRGKKVVESAKKAFKWVFKNTGNEKIFAIIPKENRAACLIAHLSGMDFINYQDNKRLFEVSKWAIL